MTPEERERMNWLMLQILQETNHAKFTRLVEELNRLLRGKENRFLETEKRNFDS